MSVDLQKIFNRETIARAIETLPEFKTPIVDTIYKKRVQHPWTIIGLEDLKKTIKNVPVVRRGSSAFKLDGDGTSISFIEPQPIEVERFVSAKDLNDIKLFKVDSIKNWADCAINSLRNVIKPTIEALAAQSLTGKIGYPMKLDGGGYASYEVDFGNVLTETTTKKWDATTTKIEDVYDLLVKMKDTIQKKSIFGGQVIVKAGSKAFTSLVKYVIEKTKDSVIQPTLTDHKIGFAGFDIELHSHTYYDFEDEKQVSEIDEKKIVMVALDAPFTLYYLAIDDLEAGLQPLPLWVTTEYTKSPSGLKIYGKSKPIPAPVVNAICWAEVTS